MNVNGNVAVVTGGASGIGLALLPAVPVGVEAARRGALTEVVVGDPLTQHAEQIDEYQRGSA